MFECSDFIRFNGLTDISFVFKNILNAHVVLGPSLRLGIDQVFETRNTIRMNCLRQETLEYKYVDVKLNLPKLWPCKWFRFTVVKDILIEHAAFEWTDDVVWELETSIVFEKVNQQITNTILTNGHIRWIAEVYHIFWEWKMHVTNLWMIWSD